MGSRRNHAPRRREARRATARARGGFTLVEVLVAVALVALLAGALAPLAVRQVRAGRIEATRERMDRLVAAMVGDEASGDHGYLGEMGAMPPSLDDLNDPAGKPGWAVDPADGVGYGFNGPYAPRVAPAGGAIVDAWNIAFQYDGATPQLTSAGPDRTFGTADDLVRPFHPLATTGDLVVTVLGLPNTGGPAEQLDATRVDVWLASSAGGVRSEALLGGGGPFAASGLHLGLHGVRAEGTGTYSGASLVRDVVAITRGTTRATLVLEQP